MQPVATSGFNLDTFFEKLYHIVVNIISYIFSIRFLVFIEVLGKLFVIALISWTVYSLIRLYEMNKAGEKKKGASTIAQTADNPVDAIPLPVAKRSPVWEALRAKLLSDSPSDWRLAIIEADIYLDRILDDNGFHGETTSDKLKQVTPDRLGSIQMAWEAHKVRNRIAHEGSAFTLTMPEARRILSYYEIIFRDFGIID